jgi:hypothetical protein
MVWSSNAVTMCKNRQECTGHIKKMRQSQENPFFKECAGKGAVAQFGDGMASIWCLDVCR